MHRTESIDYGIVLSGEIVLLLDDTAVHLKTGDVVVQRGTVHAWTNRTNEICRMAFILTDGVFEPELALSLAFHDDRLAAE
jgi:quercetin dioxygenase-like cupin family protein